MCKNTPEEMTLSEIEHALGKKIKLVPQRIVPVVNVPMGSVFKLNGYSFIALRAQSGILAISKDIVFRASISEESNNDLSQSYLFTRPAMAMKNTLLEFSKGNDINNFEPMDISLTSDNGFSDYYNIAKVRIGLLSLEEFQKYSQSIFPYPCDDWWLSTPHGTNVHGDGTQMCMVNRHNMIEHVDCNQPNIGIRPVIQIRYNTMVAYEGT